MCDRKPGRLRLLLLALGTLLLSAAPLMATTYWVRLGASDLNPGTSESKPFRTINYALTRVAAGDTIRIKGGTYHEIVKLETIQNVPNVKIMANVPRSVIIDGDGYDGSAFGTTLPVNGLTLSGLVVANCGDGIHLANAQNVLVYDCEVRGCYRGIWIENGSDVRFCKCYVHDNSRGYMMGWDGENLTGLTFTDCIAANNSTSQDGRSDGFCLESSCSNASFARCTAYGHEDSGFDLKPAGVRIDRCRAYNNTEAGFKLWRNGVQMTNSLSVDNGCYGVVAAGNDLRLWNLTLANNGGYGMKIEATSPSTVSVRNCIFGTNPVWVKTDAMFSDNNNMYATEGGGSILHIGYEREWGVTELHPGVFPLGKYSISCASPMFVNEAAGDYHLRGTSACIGHGATLNSLVWYDLDGRWRGKPVDIGAYEYIAPPVTAPLTN